MGLLALGLQALDARGTGAEKMNVIFLEGLQGGSELWSSKFGFCTKKTGEDQIKPEPTYSKTEHINIYMGDTVWWGRFSVGFVKGRTIPCRSLTECR